MTKSTEEMILNELFNLNHKIDKFQDEVREKMVTKEEFKREMVKMATKEELQKVKEELKSEMATKEELQKVKEELKSEMATKEELQKVKEELKSEMATKEELQKVKEELKSEMATKEELQKVKEELKSEMATKEDISKLVTKEEFKTEIDLQANDISQILDDIVKSFQNREKQLELRLLK